MGLPDTPFLRNVRPSQHFTRSGPRSPGSARPARLVLPNGAALEISNEARELDHVELAVGRVVVLAHDLMRDVIRGHQRPSGAISGHLEAIRGHLEAIGGRVEDTQRYKQWSEGVAAIPRRHRPRRRQSRNGVAHHAAHGSREIRSCSHQTGQRSPVRAEAPRWGRSIESHQGPTRYGAARSPDEGGHQRRHQRRHQRGHQGGHQKGSQTRSGTIPCSTWRTESSRSPHNQWQSWAINGNQRTCSRRDF